MRSRLNRDPARTGNVPVDVKALIVFTYRRVNQDASSTPSDLRNRFAVRGQPVFPYTAYLKLRVSERTLIFAIFRFTDIVLTNGLHSSNGRIEYHLVHIAAPYLPSAKPLSALCILTVHISPSYALYIRFVYTGRRSHGTVIRWTQNDWAHSKTPMPTPIVRSVHGYCSPFDFSL